MRTFKILCQNGDVIQVEPDLTLREVTQNHNAMVAMVFRSGKILHAETCNDLHDADETIEPWVKIAGGVVAIVGIG